MAYVFEVDGRPVDVSPAYRGCELVLEIDGEALVCRLETGAGSRHDCELVHEGPHGPVREPLTLLTDGDRVHIRFRGRSHEVKAIDPLTRARGDAGERDGTQRMLAPMPGVVIELLCAEGDVVAAGQTLLVIESMKLQTRIDAELAGRVVELGVAGGDTFEQGAVLARVEAESAVEGSG